MVSYCCERCGTEFSQKQHYDSHLKRKNPCHNNKLDELTKEIEKLKEDNKKLKEYNEKLNEKVNNLESKINNNEKKEISKLNIVDLFAGTGAFSYVFNKHKDRFNCVLANDMVKPSELIYKLNFPNHNFKLKNLNNIRVQDIPSHNILCGGFPCQPFSIAGEQKGFDDERSNVFNKIIKILKHHKPEIVILENVKNLESHDKKKTFQTIKSKLEKLSYYIKHCILDTSKFTEIPQHRERIYIICFKNKELYDKFNFEFPTKVNKPIKEFLEDNIIDKYYYNNKLKVYDEIKKSVTKSIDDNILYQYRRYYVRENKSNQCPTLTANMGGGGHNVPLLLDKKGIRKLTPRECFNLQGFPSDYKLPNTSDSQLYKLAGNAVSIPIVELIVNQIVNII